MTGYHQSQKLTLPLEPMSDSIRYHSIETIALILLMLTTSMYGHISLASRGLRCRTFARSSSDEQIKPLIDTNNDSNCTHLMRLALRHAQHAFREKEVPIGAVLIDIEGRVIATGRNQVEKMQDPTCHAEINCIRAAVAVQSNWRLIGHTLYTTLEPCPMCMGAIQAARIKRVVYGAKDLRLGALGSWIDMTQDNKHPFHDVDVHGGVLENESGALLSRFFTLRRREAEQACANATALSFFDRGYDFKQATDGD